ncbi:MAG: four helix bundle protein [Anaerolineales bacterium]|uniref:Four helix bundle protein n=1 Tax=Candidatus Desulfolinea nitratireducens TaxID=2841698 RepID=A0A8J6NHL0_9CHLR|nr:four helix bundle protein [Candidatus Desulfolinea nitratireducens]MBL6960881.1 four helix bundle protein [Anaerolineales bacterium]
MSYASRFQDLIVYQKASVLWQLIFETTKSFPREEIFSLTDQIRRSSRSVGAQIAEAWGKRRYEKHFISKLTDADGEQLETQHWIGVAKDSGYISQEKAEILLGKSAEVGRLLGGMMRKSSLFCNPSKVSEIQADYFAD